LTFITICFNQHIFLQVHISLRRRDVPFGAANLHVAQAAWRGGAHHRHPATVSARILDQGDLHIRGGFVGSLANRVILFSPTLSIVFSPVSCLVAFAADGDAG
jgi:hypothetical protein